MDSTVIDEQMARFRQVLKSRGLRLTRQREKVLFALLKSDDHVSAEELYARIGGREDGIGTATVYRTLRLLVDAGLAESRQFGDGVQRFESAAEGHHDHIICRECGKVWEFDNEEIEQLQRQVASSRGFEIIDHRLELYVRCKRSDCFPESSELNS
tara:strand:- start:566 stop:1033 length:468 start_codon:yes stop_codon:yes gene_type:complete